MTSYGYIIMIIVDLCIIWFQLEMQLNAEKVLLILAISLTDNNRINEMSVPVKELLKSSI